ncbi:MAG: aromatic amino acid ammonia-lyase, partial [Bacteroidales bacterium]|nr:aromatic amino acid ammonia-lyase [Bacteroidales bacterium]
MRVCLDRILKLEDVRAIVENNAEIHIGDALRNRVDQSFGFLMGFSKDKVIYGINTGFGPMAQWRIEDARLKELQYNIIRSHATGAGKPLPIVYVRAAMLARLMTFVQGYSGVNRQTCELLMDFLNYGLYPVIPQHGSVGASGDLVQLAHIALALIGEGEVFYQDRRRPTAEVFAELGLEPLRMYIREGLAVTNGTAVMTGIG